MKPSHHYLLVFGRKKISLVVICKDEKVFLPFNGMSILSKHFSQLFYSHVFALIFVENPSSLRFLHIYLIA
jgi:hypothetical protein